MPDDVLSEVDGFFAEEYGELIFDENLSAEEKTIDSILKKAIIDTSDFDIIVEKDKLISFIKGRLYKKFRDFAVKEYLIMKKSGYYGLMGKEQITLSFARSILKIPNDYQVYSTDLSSFYTFIDNYEKKLGDVSLENLRSDIKNETITILGKEFNSFSSLRDWIYSLKIGMNLYFSPLRDGLARLIFGETEDIEINTHNENLKILLFKKEFIRSPNLTLSTAGCLHSGIGQYFAIIRMETCEKIFYNKRVGYFYESYYEKKRNYHTQIPQSTRD